MASRVSKIGGVTACALVVLALVSSPSGAAATVSVVAGTGKGGAAGDGGPGNRAELAAPSGVAVDGAGDVAVADTGNCRVRLIAARRSRRFGIAMKAGHIYTVAGSGCGRSGHRRSVSVGAVTGVAFDRAGDLLIADGSGNRILELPASSGHSFGVAVRAGHLTTVAGTGVAGTSRSGAVARSGRLDDPEAVALDAAGDLYIADTEACRVDEVPGHDETEAGTSRQAGHLYSVVGTGVCGAGGDGGPAGAAQLWTPAAIAFDQGGDLLIADEGNSAVREVAAVSGTFYGVAISAGDIATVAGEDTYTDYIGDGLSAASPVADINYPTGLAVDTAGDLLIADDYDRCVRVVPARTTTLLGRAMKAGDMYTVVGLLPTGGSVPPGDGTQWVLTRVVYPYGVAVAPDGSIVFSDQGANKVRRISGVAG
jgi:hypothetical protein